MWKWVLIGLNFALASCALWVAIMASSTLKRLTKLVAARSSRSLAQLDAELTSLSSAFSSMSRTVRNLNSRIAMRDARARTKEELSSEPEPKDPVARKAWLRKGLAKGTLRVIRDGAPSAAAEDS